MGKLTTYMFIMSGVILLAYFFGLVENTATSTFLNLLLNPGSLQTSTLYTKLILIVETAIIVGATIFSVTQKSDFPLIALLIVPLLNFGWDFMTIFQKMSASNTTIAILVFSPFILVYILTVIEWWRGFDT